jgi:UDP-N-acetylmuramoyl-tripeptide--D-alanyl-D-alanine ligase
MKKILSFILNILARGVRWRYRPKIIGITGSIGKTTTKEAVFAVLSSRFRVRRSLKNYNNELGVPISIIGCDSPGKSLMGWFKVFGIALRLIARKDPDYPEMLILEMGVDRPGDMKYLTDLARPEVGIVTAITSSHLQYFGSIAKIKKEKLTLIENLPTSGLAVLNYDSELARQGVALSRCPVTTYGRAEGADIAIQEIHFNFLQDFSSASKNLGLNFKLNHKGSIVPVSLFGAMSYPVAYACAAAAAVGLYYGLNLVEIALALRVFKLPPGRMNPLPGLNGSSLIDDTYNASPESILSALEILAQISVKAPARKIALLGDMLELGEYHDEGHTQVGEAVVASGATLFLAVGEGMKIAASAARAVGQENIEIKEFQTGLEAADYLKSLLKPGDVVLVKASQGMRLEKAVKMLMAKPEEAGELLVRQGSDWK